MARLCVVALLLCVICAFLQVNALNVVSQERSFFVEGAHLLPRSVQFSNKSFCFFSTGSAEQAKRDKPVTMCSFDAGVSVAAVETAHPLCASGVIVDGTVYCPREEVPNDEDGEVTYSVVAFAPQGTELKEESAEHQFVFRSGKQTGEVKQVLFDGNAVRLDDDEDTLVLVSSIVNDAEERKVAVFKSEDGFLFKPLAVVSNLESAVAHYLFYEGGRRLTLVSELDDAQYLTVSSGYSGAFWSTPKTLAITAPPASALYSSGVLVQYACSNESAAAATWYATEDGAKRALAAKLPAIAAAKDDAGSPLLLFAVAGAKDTKELVVVRNEVSSKKAAGVQLSVFQVDDSAEVKERADKLAKAREETLKKEAARFKAKMEKLEREKAQRREQRRKELEQKRKFLAEDEPNVHAAKVHMEEDGEMIIVRRVKKETVALEKEVFFSDL